MTLAYNHHQNRIADVLNNIHHESLTIIRSSIHVYMENDNCVAVIIIQGEAGKISEIYKNIVKNKGIQHVKLDTINPQEI
ncbi:MAG: hypothetical protein HF976_13975 [ANME-2 cluster archaeon]|nr:hypothetical protein [ANME-2 cluster archaeon]